VLKICPALLPDSVLARSRTRDFTITSLTLYHYSRVFNSPEFSGRHDFQAKIFGRQCTKSGSHARKIKQKLNAKQYLLHMCH